MPSDQVMKEFGKGNLHSGSKEGPVVKNRTQAVAIMLSERKKEGKPVKRKSSRSGGRSSGR